MKYILVDNKEWSESQIIGEEYLLFETPDDFKFDRTVFDDFLENKGIEYAIENNGYKIKYMKQYFAYINIRDILSKKGIEGVGTQEEFLRWLTENKNVKNIEVEVI